MYETKDGRYITVGAGEPHFYLNLLRGLGYSESEIAELPSQVDASQWEYMKGELQKKFHQKTLQEWCEVSRTCFCQNILSVSCLHALKIFSSIDACVQPVLDRDDMKSHPHVQARGMFVRQQNGTDVPTPSPRLSAGSRVGLPFLANGRVLLLILPFRVLRKRLFLRWDNTLAKCLKNWLSPQRKLTKCFGQSAACEITNFLS